MNIPHNYTAITNGFELAWEQNQDRIFVRANIRSRPFLLGDARIDEQKVIPFTVHSVAGVEVGGRISYIPDKSLKAKP